MKLVYEGLEVDLADDSITVDGIKVRFSFLKTLADPNPNLFYRFYVDKGEAYCETFQRKDIEKLVNV